MTAKRSWTAEQKIAILDEAFAPGACVSDAAERHELNTGQLYAWRQLFLDGKLVRSLPPAPAFARVDMAPAQALASRPRLIEPLAAVETAAQSSGAIEIELKSGVRIRVEPRAGARRMRPLRPSWLGRFLLSGRLDPGPATPLGLGRTASSSLGLWLAPPPGALLGLTSSQREVSDLEQRPRAGHGVAAANVSDWMRWWSGISARKFFCWALLKIIPA